MNIPHKAFYINAGKIDKYKFISNNESKINVIILKLTIIYIFNKKEHAETRCTLYIVQRSALKIGM